MDGSAGDALFRSAVLRAVRSRPGISRSEVAELLGISASTVTRTVGRLIQEGMLIEGQGIERADAPGRRPLPLLLNGHAYHLIGIEMTATELVGAIANLDGEIAHERRWPMDVGPDSEEALKQLYEALSTLLAEASRLGIEARAIGIGAPGVTEAGTGVVRWAPAFGWRDLPLQTMVEERVRLPAFVENDVNLAAFGERWFGVAQGASSVFYAYLGRGIGGGLIIGDQLHRGHHRTAGEVGYVVPDRKLLVNDYRDRGCLETLATRDALSGRARQLLKEHPESALRKTIRGDALTVAHILAARDSGDGLGRLLADELLDHLAVMLVSVISVADPELIVLGGDLARAGPELIELIVERLLRVAPAVPELRLSTLGPRAGVVGAVAYALFELERLGPMPVVLP